MATTWSGPSVRTANASSTEESTPPENATPSGVVVSKVLHPPDELARSVGRGLSTMLVILGHLGFLAANDHSSQLTSFPSTQPLTSCISGS